MGVLKGLFKGDEGEGESTGSTLGTPGTGAAEAPPGDDESFVVSGGGLANESQQDGGPGGEVAQADADGEPLPEQTT